MASALNGYILVYRKIQEHWLWDNTEPFDKAHAWIDLIFTARWKEKDVFFGGSLVTVKRGQMVTSIRHLGERWNWSRTKVITFLDALENDQMIVRKSDTKKTLITIVNYEFYQDLAETDETPKSRQNDTEMTPKRHKKDRMNKGNKGNEGNKERENIKEKEIFPSGSDETDELPENEQTDDTKRFLEYLKAKGINEDELSEDERADLWWDSLEDGTPEEWKQK